MEIDGPGSRKPNRSGKSYLPAPLRKKAIVRLLYFVLFFNSITNLCRPKIYDFTVLLVEGKTSWLHLPAINIPGDGVGWVV